jgi:hypothetical protein
MRPALFYIPDAALRSGPSAHEAEALRQARIAQVRALVAEIAAEQPALLSRTHDAAATCRCCERLVA